jgi:hypothetical protein
MTMVQENIIMTMSELNSMESRVNAKQETIEDYKKIDSFLTKVGLPVNYLLLLLNKEGFYDFNSLHQYRNAPPVPRDYLKEGRITGLLTGLISYLKDKL